MNSGVISARIRWLAIVAGCSSAVVGVSFGAFFAAFPAILILGAIVPPRAPTTGRWLLWVIALLLSVMLVPFGFGVVLESPKMLRINHGGMMILISSMFAVSTASLLWLDVALVMEAFRAKHRPWVRGSLDWVVWIAAIALSAWRVRIAPFVIYAYRNGRFFDLFLLNLVPSAVILLFDVALILHAVKSRPTVLVRTS